MKTVYILFGFLFITNNTRVIAQKFKDDVESLGYNVSLGVLTTTLGSIINKPKNQNTWECIKKSWWQGAIGGTLQFCGKKMLQNINGKSDLSWGWPSKLVHSAGVSICTNGALGNSFGRYWVFDYACLHLNIHNQNGKVKLDPQFNLLFVYDMYFGLSEAKIDWLKSIELGTFCLVADKVRFDWQNGKRATGFANTRTIAYAKYSPHVKQTLKHEVIHTYQSNEYRVMNTYFNPLISKIKHKNINTMFKYIYIEFPFYSLFYGITYNKNRFPANFYEQEARDFAGQNKN